ncbi:MAG: BON domain-containing protein [Planctomycetia bacterium]|nr:BON domain-containing protein [Planctomycetia bacterium]
MIRRFFFSTAMLTIAAMLPAGAYGTEQEAAQEIADAIRSSGRLKDYSIGVKFEGGTAILMGRVANDQQAQTAVQMAETMPGVTSVVNNLEVKATAKKDFEITPTAHDNSARRATTREEMVFGSEAAAQPAPVAAQVAARQQPGPVRQQQQQQQQQQQVRRTSFNGNAGGPIPMGGGYQSGSPIPIAGSSNSSPQRVNYDQPHMPCNAWPSYAAYPNYGAVTYPNQYSASAWPYIGPFYPYPQVPLGWRKVTMEWKDGWWFLDFNDTCRHFRR